ncbi:ABC transporter substrate-binding protein [Desertibaculum subflavum]|uniref:ABC transporter substrate-binding protein n=1 Tax=Desertibaculum subflavum TaxID=2268458 RepID=UPI000E665672
MKRLALIAMLAALAAGPAAAETPGVTKTEIRLGQTMPYSGNASAYGVVGKATAAYFEKINREQGGISGRKIVFISLDDGYSPPKTVEQTRRLVEQDEVLAILGTLGTPTNTAIHRYLNAKKVPQLLITTGAHKWADPKGYPWTMPGMVSYQTEGTIYGRYLRATRPDAKIALLSQNDDFGRDYIHGFKQGLGEAAQKMIVAETTYEVSDPKIDSQIIALKASGADAFFSVTLGKFSSQAIRKAAEIGWKPQPFIVPTSSVGIKTILEPAGIENAAGLISASTVKTVSDPQWAGDAGMREYLAFLKAYMPDLDPNDSGGVTGYHAGMIMAQILKQCGEDLSRANVMRQAASLHMQLPMLLPGIEIKTGPDDYLPLQQLRMQRFDGKTWQLFGEPIDE